MKRTHYKRYGLVYSVIFGVFLSFSCQVSGMWAEIIGEEGVGTAVKEALGEGAESAITRALEDNFGSIGETLSENMSAELKQSLKEAAENALKNIDTNGLNAENFASRFENSFAVERQNLSTAIEKLGSEGKLSGFDRVAIQDVKFTPNQLTTIGNLKFEAPTVITRERLGIKVEGAGELDQIDQAAGQVEEAQAEAINIEETGGDATAAQQKVKQLSDTLQSTIDGEIKSATQDAATATKEVDAQTAAEQKALNEGDAKTAAQAKQKKIDAKASERVSKQKADEFNKVSSRKKYIEAGEKLKSAKNELKEAKKSGDETRIEAAKEKQRIAQEDFDSARKDYIEKGGTFEGKRIAALTKSGAKSGSLEIGKMILSNIASGFLFTIPNIIIDGAQNERRNIDLRNTLRHAQRFGKMWLKIPRSLINNNDPSNSKYVYVGVPDPNFNVNDPEFLKTANYFVSINDYFNQFAATAITDPNFTNIMLHLNTGYIFVGDGQPYDYTTPTIPFLNAAKPFTYPLLDILDQLAGQVAKGPKVEQPTWSFGTESSSYDGNQVIADLFTKPTQEAYPLLLKPSVAAIENGTYFGQMKIQGIKGMAGAGIANLAALGAPNVLAAPDEPYVTQGIQVYQTQDTPLAKALISTVPQDDQNHEVLTKILADYIILMDKDLNLLSDNEGLLTPLPDGPNNFPTYKLNPKVVYIQSILDPAGWYYDIEGKKKGKQDHAAVFKKALARSNSTALAYQMQVMEAYANKNAQNGPFQVGGVTLTITKNQLENKLYIYKAEKFLESGDDDYLVPYAQRADGTGVVPAALPTDVVYFISLVTSRFYDDKLQPMLNQKVPYQVVTPAGGKPILVTGQKVDQTKPFKYAPIYMLFVDGDLNQSDPNGETLPVPAQWAFDTKTVDNGDKSPTFRQACKTSNPALAQAIDTAHTSWRKYFLKDPKNAWALANAMGPHLFASSGGGVVTIYITGVSQAAIANQNYVYVSKYYPGEFLVVADDPAGTGAGKEFSDQRYLISLSSGAVYDARPDSTSGMMPGDRVKMPLVDLTSIMSKVEGRAPLLAELKSKILASEQAYNRSISKMLWSDATKFGRFQFYINKDDYFAQQYIYADVTDLGNPLNPDGSENAAVLSKVNDYYVCLSQVPETDAKGNVLKNADGTVKFKVLEKDGVPVTDKNGNPIYETQLAQPLGPYTTRVYSLITGAIFDAGGMFVGNADQFLITQGQQSTGDTIEDIAKFTSLALSAVAVEAGVTTVRLAPVITKLLQATKDRLLKERKELTEEEKQEEALYQPLAAKNSIDAATYLPENPNLAPRYLKYVGKKYYSVIQDESGNPISYFDYNVTPQKDGGVGMLYDANGIAQIAVRGWQLTIARAYAGVIVGADGSEQRTLLAVDTPGLQMKDTTGKSLLIPTNFPLSEGQTSRTLPGGAILDRFYGKVTYDVYYHTKLDAYFLHVTTEQPTAEFYIDLAQGTAYQTDGSPRLEQLPVFVNQPTDAKQSPSYLLIGADNVGFKKIALAMPGQSYYRSFSMNGLYCAQQFSQYNSRGIYYEMVDDENPSFVLGVGYAMMDLTGKLLAEPYYLVWVLSTNRDVEGADDTGKTPTDAFAKDQFLGIFKADPTLQFSLMGYAQSRPAGSGSALGTFDANDAYIDASKVDNLKLRTVGIIFDQNKILKALIYNNNWVALTAQDASTYSGKIPTATGSQSVTVKDQRVDIATGIKGHWLSITDGNKIKDYLYNNYTMPKDPAPTVPDSLEGTVCTQSTNDTGDDTIDLTPQNLSDIKYLSSFDSSSFIPNAVMQQGSAQGTNGLFKALSGARAVTQVKFPANLQQGYQSIVNDFIKSRAVKMTTAGAVYFPAFAGKNQSATSINRFFYTFSPLSTRSIESKLSYYTTAWKGMSVDLSNGVVYQQNGTPTGYSLLPSQLSELLDFLMMNVSLDANGLPVELVFRYTDPQSQAAAQSGAQTPRPLASPAPRQPQLRPALSTRQR